MSRPVAISSSSRSTAAVIAYAKGASRWGAAASSNSISGRARVDLRVSTARVNVAGTAVEGAQAGAQGGGRPRARGAPAVLARGNVGGVGGARRGAGWGLFVV